MSTAQKGPQLPCQSKRTIMAHYDLVPLKVKGLLRHNIVPAAAVLAEETYEAWHEDCFAPGNFSPEDNAESLISLE